MMPAQTAVRKTDGFTLEDIVKAVAAVLQPTMQMEAPKAAEKPVRNEPESPTEVYRNRFISYPEILQAKHCKAILGISTSKTYEVMNSHDFPLLKISGKRKLVRKDAFIQYILDSEGQPDRGFGL